MSLDNTSHPGRPGPDGLASGSVFCGSWRRNGEPLVATHLSFPSVCHVRVVPHTIVL
jgi:hypothetical protein